MKSELIAPCGMNCNICSAYLAYSLEIPKETHCKGCRPRNKQCGFLKKRCEDNLKLHKGKIKYCFECNCFPCGNLKLIDARYRKNYGMSMIENLELLKTKGIRKLLEKERKRWKCPKCGGTICVHNLICYDCERNKLKKRKSGKDKYRWPKNAKIRNPYID